MRRKKAEQQPAPASGETRITPAEVQQVEFRLAFRGYNERDVDTLLDRITEDLSQYIEENQRLRTGAGAAGAAGLSLEAAQAQATRIVAEARAEAARIVRETEARAAVSGAGAGDARAAVAPFLNKERDFLQGLGALVQGHAEEVKQMVLAIRARSEGSSAVPSAVPAPSAVPVPSAVPAPPPVPAPEPREQPASAEHLASSPPSAANTTEEEAFAPITVPGSDGSASSGTEEAPSVQATVRPDSGERSLRELFWGED
jgi:DivIVA domain-containing protein